MGYRSEFRPPPLEVDAARLRAYFEGAGPDSDRLLTNHHHEEPVAPERHAQARPASVLIGLVDEPDPWLLMTRRHHSISAPGQICFPGGNQDHDAERPIETAVREAAEETALDPIRVEPLGILGVYYSHSGHRITPVVAVIQPPVDLRPREGEVEEILRVPSRTMFHPDSYRLVKHRPDRPHAHWFLSDGDASITGPTVCIAMHLYEELARTA